MSFSYILEILIGNQHCFLVFLIFFYSLMNENEEFFSKSCFTIYNFLYAKCLSYLLKIYPVGSYQLNYMFIFQKSYDISG